jgi:carbonic anhydrase
VILSGRSSLRSSRSSMQEEQIDDIMQEAVYATVWYTMARILERSTVIAAAVRKGDLLVKGAVYSLSTNEVTILEEEG